MPAAINKPAQTTKMVFSDEDYLARFPVGQASLPPTIRSTFSAVNTQASPLLLNGQVYLVSIAETSVQFG